MITIRKIKIYEKYRGYYDGYYLQNKENIGTVITDKEWIVIRDLIHEIFLVESGNASEEFRERLENKLLLDCDSLETIEYLKNVKNW